MAKKKATQYQTPQDKRLNEAIKAQLQKATFNGMAVAAKTYCKLFKEKIDVLTPESTEAEKDAVLADIKHFCEVGLGTNKQ